MIRTVMQSDAGALCDIYNEYVLNSTKTFEEDAVSKDEMLGRIINISRSYPWLVCEDENEILGYTYAKEWKERSAYRYTVETGIYIKSTHLEMGFGTKLKAALLEKLRAQGIHSVISGIALPNPASIALCEKFGYEKVAHFKELGFKFDQWVDIGYWQLIL